MPYKKTKDGSLVNEVTLGDGYPLSNDKQPLKVGGEASIINVSSPTPDGSVDGEVEVKGKLRAKDTIIQGDLKAFTDNDTTPQFVFESTQGANNRFDVKAAANTRSAIRIFNNQGYFELRRDSSTTSLKFTDGTNTPLTLDGDNVEFTNLTDGSITIDSFVDEDNMSSNSATKVPTQQSVKAYVDNEVAGLVDSAPAALDTLNELAAALGDDASFATTVTNSIATKLPLAGGTLTGDLTINSPASKLILSGDDTSENHAIESDANLYLTIDKDADDTSNFFQFRSHSGGTLTEIMRIKDTGEVGIGTTSPTTTLHVEGSFKATGVADFDDRVDINETSFPQLTFSDDGGTDKMNMGQSGEIFYFKTSDTANDIRFRRSDNTDVLNFDMSNARVGIGTTSPSVKLDVEESSVSALIDIHQSASSTGTDSGIRFQKNSNLKGTVGYNAGTDTVNLNYGAFDNTHLNIDSSGKVGIGTASPSEMLHLKGAGDVKILLEADTDNTTETDNPEIMFSQDGGGVTGSIGFTDVNDLRITNAYNHDDGDIHLQTRSTTRMSVLGNGNVGIGTGSASTLLHIHKEMSNNADNSLMTIQGDLASGDLGTEKVLIDFTMTDANANNYPQVKIGAAVGKNSDANSLSKEGSGAFVVYTSAGTSDVDGEDNTAERMRVDYQGNVGIGTTSPQSALHVEEGDIRIDTAQNGTQALRFSDRNGTEGQLQYNSQYLKLRMLTDAADGTDTKRLTVLGGQDATAVGIGTDDPTTTLDVEGTVSYKSIGLSSSSDAFDVSGATTVTANSASGNIILGGFSNGVLGQIIHVIHRSPTNSLRFEHNEATATQPIYTSTSADKTLSGYGGMTLFCDGSNWFEIGN